MKKISKNKFQIILLIVSILSAYGLWVLTIMKDTDLLIEDALVSALGITALFLVIVAVIGVGIIWLMDKYVE